MSSTEYNDAVVAPNQFTQTQEGMDATKQLNDAWKNVKLDANGNIVMTSSVDKDGNESWKTFNADGPTKAEGVKNADGSGHAKINDDHGNRQREVSFDKNGKSNNTTPSPLSKTKSYILILHPPSIKSRIFNHIVTIIL